MSTYRFYTCTHCKAKIGLPASEDHHNELHPGCRRGDGILIADDVKTHHEIEFHALEAIKHLHALEDRIDELDADLRKEMTEIIASLQARIDTVTG